MRLFWLTLAIVLGVILGLFLRQAKADIVEDVLGCPGDPCIIKRSPGGEVFRFEAAIAAIQSGARKHIVIDGICASACVRVPTELPRRTCLTEHARLLFHRGTQEFYFLIFKWEERYVPVYSGRVETWKRSVKLPEDGSPVEMPWTIAKTIWPRCPTQHAAH